MGVPLVKLHIGGQGLDGLRPAFVQGAQTIYGPGVAPGSGQTPPRDPTLELPAARVKGRGLLVAGVATLLVLALWALSWGSDAPIAFEWVEPRGAEAAPSRPHHPSAPLVFRLNPAPGSEWVIESYAEGPSGRVSWRPQAVGGPDGELLLKTRLQRDLGPPEEMSSAKDGSWRLALRLVPRGADGPPAQELELRLVISSSASASANPME